MQQQTLENRSCKLRISVALALGCYVLVGGSSSAVAQAPAVWVERAMTVKPEEVQVAPLSLERLKDVLAPDRWRLFEQALLQAGELVRAFINAAGQLVCGLAALWLGYVVVTAL